MGADTGAASALALFPDPIRGTHASDAPLMILGLTVGPGAVTTLLCVGTDGRPGWFPFGDVTFDWRWSDELGRWADLEELMRGSVPVSAPARRVCLASLPTGTGFRRSRSQRRRSGWRWRCSAPSPTRRTRTPQDGSRLRGTAAAARLGAERLGEAVPGAIGSARTSHSTPKVSAKAAAITPARRLAASVSQGFAAGSPITRQVPSHRRAFASSITGRVGGCADARTTISTHRRRTWSISGLGVMPIPRLMEWVRGRTATG
jgi:hypothetical protein